jgi:tRNA-specific 2-thiouridylase
MDMKKKLDDIYNPDKGDQKSKVVIGLSGGIISYVTAYLLKIQKYELVAVTISNSWEDYSGDVSQVFSCHNDTKKIDEIKEFCHKLGIPHHVVKASNEFKETVIEPWLADKLLGRFPRPCWNCHALRMKLLYEKMLEVGANHMATGHFAKLFRHQSHGTVFVHTSNDEQHDQSALLSRLPHDILNSLVLPLSDLSKNEVLKLAENFGFTQDNKKIAFQSCLKWSDEIAQLVIKKIPKKFIKGGEITSEDSIQSYGRHDGVFFHTFGEEYEYQVSGKPMKGYFGNYAYSEKRMILYDADYFLRDKFVLTNCIMSEEVSWVEPLKGFVLLPHLEFAECWIHLKPLGCVLIEMSEKHKLLNGQILGIVKKKGKNSKIFLTGEVLLLKIEPETPEGVQSVQKVNYSLDF